MTAACPLLLPDGEASAAHTRFERALASRILRARRLGREYASHRPTICHVQSIIHATEREAKTRCRATLEELRGYVANVDAAMSVKGKALHWRVASAAHAPGIPREGCRMEVAQAIADALGVFP